MIGDIEYSLGEAITLATSLMALVVTEARGKELACTV